MCVTRPRLAEVAASLALNDGRFSAAHAEDPGRRRPAQHAHDARDDAARRRLRGRRGRRRRAGRASAARPGAYDVVLTDLRMGTKDGIDVLRAVKEAQPLTEVIVMTAYGTIESAVEAMRLGAFDYIQKPFTEQELLVKVQKARREPAPRRRGRVPRERVQGALQVREHHRPLAGRARGARAHRPHRADRRDRAHHRRERHRQGARRQGHPRQLASAASGPFVPVNCAAITETLLESELFGHARGSFTGAVTRAQGALRGGRRRHVLLRRDRRDADRLPGQAPPRDPGERDPPRRREQAASTSTCASSRRPTRICMTAVAEKRFRQDLYYRLNVARFQLPPLRERREDIPDLRRVLPRQVQPQDGRARAAPRAASSRRSRTTTSRATSASSST